MYQGRLMVILGICVAHEYLRPQLGATRRMRDLGCPHIERGPVDRCGRVNSVQWVKRRVYGISQIANFEQSSELGSTKIMPLYTPK